jgi:peptidoglycan hydrolase FlgJ
MSLEALAPELHLVSLPAGNPTPTLARFAAQTTARTSSTTEAQREAQMNPKLVTAAHQFVASLIAELVKPLNSGGGLGNDDDDARGSSSSGSLGSLDSSAEGSEGAVMTFGAEALAKAISDHGGLGIARRVLEQLRAADSAAVFGDGKARSKSGDGLMGSEVNPGMNPGTITKVI